MIKSLDPALAFIPKRILRNKKADSAIDSAFFNAGNKAKNCMQYKPRIVTCGQQAKAPSNIHLSANWLI